MIHLSFVINVKNFFAVPLGTLREITTKAFFCQQLFSKFYDFPKICQKYPQNPCSNQLQLFTVQQIKNFFLKIKIILHINLY